MATIESLDLATLTNNPQSIAEALEDVLETSSGNIGSLKTSAQEDHDAIEALRTSAQEDHDAIEALSDNFVKDTEYVQPNGTGWSGWDYEGAISDENGLRLFRYGPIFVLHASIRNTTLSTGSGYATIHSSFSSDMSPSNEMRLGLIREANSSDDDYISLLRLKDNGVLDMYYNNASGTGMWIIGNFIGIDV